MTSNIIRVGYDIDGTLANFIKGWTGQASQIFPSIDQMLDDKELEEYDLHKKYGGKRANAVWQAIQRRSFFYETLSPFKEAVESTRKTINKENVEPHYITARQHGTIKNYFGQLNRHEEKREKKRIRRHTTNWLGEYGLWGQVHMETDKAKKATDLALDFYIDNNSEHILDVQRKTSTRSYLLDKKYNRSADVRERVESVKEFNEKVTTLADKL